jgi:hypothetical protein
MFLQGDRDKITLFGPDAGASAAGILAVMPKTRWTEASVVFILKIKSLYNQNMYRAFY